jgi:urease beta subunit
MSISRFYTTTFAVTRMSWANESSAEISAGSFYGHIQQANPEFASQIAEAWGKTFVVWCDKATDVEPGDTLTIASGDYAGTYSVKNKQVNATGSNEHLELTVIKDVT